MAITNLASTRLLSQKLVSDRTFAYEGVVDYVGGRMIGMYIDEKTYAYNNVTCLNSNNADCECCGDSGPPYFDCNTCGTWYYLSINLTSAEAIPSSSFKTSPSGGYYDTSTRKGFKTLGYCGNSRPPELSNEYRTCGTNCAGSATEAYIKANMPDDGFGTNAVAAIKAQDGSLWTWGCNGFGQLGNNTVTRTYSPVQLGTESWKMVRGNYLHFAAIRKDDTLWTWGYNGFGQLGDNSTANRSSPVQVSGSWKFITVGAYTTFGIKSDDTLWCWGSNGNGALGDGTTTTRSSPVQVSGGGTWKFAMCDGDNVSCGIKTDGRAYAWGNNAYYQVGDGTNTNRSSPVLVAGGFSDWEHISIQGWTWKHGIRSNGTLWCWGHLPLGVSNAVTYRSSPVQVGSETDHASGSSQPSYNGVYVSTVRNAAFVLKNGNLISYNGYNSTRTTLYGSGSVVEYIPGHNGTGGGTTYTGNYIIKNVKY